MMGCKVGPTNGDECGFFGVHCAHLIKNVSRVLPRVFFSRPAVRPRQRETTYQGTTLLMGISSAASAPGCVPLPQPQPRAVLLSVEPSPNKYLFCTQEEELAQQGLLYQSYGLSLTAGNEMDATPVFADLPPGLGFYDIRRRFVDRAKRIDTVSRALFPMSFLVFNVLYWLTYKVLRHEDLLAAL